MTEQGPYAVAQVQDGAWVAVGTFATKQEACACRAALKKTGVEGSRLSIRDSHKRLVK